MEWAPTHNQSSGNWQPEWVCPRCGGSISPNHPLLQSVPTQPYCAEHGSKNQMGASEASSLAIFSVAWWQGRSRSFIPLSCKQHASLVSSLCPPVSELKRWYAPSCYPHHTTISVDGIGAHDHISRASMFTALAQVPQANGCLPFMRFFLHKPIPVCLARQHRQPPCHTPSRRRRTGRPFNASLVLPGATVCPIPSAQPTASRRAFVRLPR